MHTLFIQFQQKYSSSSVANQSKRAVKSMTFDGISLINTTKKPTKKKK